MVWTAAVKIAYDGKYFNGSQRQPDVGTVEGEVLRALVKIGAIRSAKESRFRVASRTDRGVSALGNVICFDTDFDEGHIVHALNAVSDNVHYLGMAQVPHDFSPRRGRERWYRYFHPAEGIDQERFRSCAEQFVGRHDFRRFCKPEGRVTIKTLDRIEVMELGDVIVVDLYAREFLRNMVRRLVSAMAEVGRGRASLEDVSALLDGREGSFGLAEAEGLVLMDVRYDIEIPLVPTRPFQREVSQRRRRAMVDLFFYDSLSELSQVRPDLGPV